MEDEELKELVEKRIMLSKADWVILLRTAEEQGITIYFKDDSIHNTANMYLSQAKDLLNSEGVKILLGMADQHMQDKRSENKQKPPKKCPKCNFTVEAAELFCHNCNFQLD